MAAITLGILVIIDHRIMMKKTAILILFISTWGLQSQQINWLSFEEAVSMVHKPGNKKKVFIDVYTDWCGWCKKMDTDTFQNPQVSAYMNAHFLMVKLNAEQKEPINYDGRTFNYVANGRRGYHELAVALLNGKLSYPTVVFLDENMGILSPIPGYQKVEGFMEIARYFGDNIYKEKDWKTYSGK